MIKTIYMFILVVSMFLYFLFIGFIIGARNERKKQARIELELRCTKLENDIQALHEMGIRLDKLR